MKALRKFGLLDVIIILALLLGAFILVRTMSQRDTTAEKSRPIVYTFETLEVGEEFVESLSIGDTVYHSIRNEELGKIKSFTAEPFEIEYRNHETGTIDLIEKPEKYTVLIEIESKYTMADEEKIMVGEEEIRVGKSIPLKGMGYATFGYVVEIRN
jgi:hypothetical protein